MLAAAADRFADVLGRSRGTGESAQQRARRDEYDTAGLIDGAAAGSPTATAAVLNLIFNTVDGVSAAERTRRKEVIAVRALASNVRWAEQLHADATRWMNTPVEPLPRPTDGQAVERYWAQAKPGSYWPRSLEEADACARNTYMDCIADRICAWEHHHGEPFYSDRNDYDELCALHGRRWLRRSRPLSDIMDPAKLRLQIRHGWLPMGAPKDRATAVLSSALLASSKRA